MIVRSQANRFAFWVSASVVAHTLWTSAAPSMIYPVYAMEWKLSLTMITVIFAVYPLTVVMTMLLFSGLSDHVGRKRVMLAGLISSALGVLMFALANGLSMLIYGRILMGIGVGLSAGPSAAALIDYAGENKSSFAGSVTLIAQSAGFTAALLLSGALLAWSPDPTFLSFAILFALLIGLAVLCCFMPTEIVAQYHGRLLAHPHVPKYLTTPFCFAALAVLAAYTHGVMIASLGAVVAKSLIGSPDPLINSLALSFFPISLGIIGAFTRKRDAYRAVIIGSTVSVVGMISLCTAVGVHSLFLFICASLISGAGYAYMTFGGLTLIAQKAMHSDLGNAMSMLFVFAYLFTGGLAIVLGKTATLINLSFSVYTGAGLLIGICLILIICGYCQLQKCEEQLSKTL